MVVYLYIVFGQCYSMLPMRHLHTSRYVILTMSTVLYIFPSFLLLPLLSHLEVNMQGYFPAALRVNLSLFLLTCVIVNKVGEVLHANKVLFHFSFSMIIIITAVPLYSLVHRMLNTAIACGHGRGSGYI